MRLFDHELRQPKQFRTGTHRARTPQETLDAYLPVAPSIGITRIACITGLDNIGLPVYTCIRPNARALATSQGKGIDAASAKVSALMESIEAWHAEHVRLPARHASARELAGESAVIDIGSLPVLRGAQARDDVPLWWVQGWDLLGARAMWVPYETVSLSFVYPPGHRSTFSMSSNGLASGNHPLEAIAHGLLEVIERDADAAWLRRDEAAFAASVVDLDTVDDPTCRAVLDLLARAGVRAALFDATSDVGIPTYRCTIYPAERDPLRPVGPAGGIGCHLAPEIAAARAITEAVQSRVTMIAGSRDDMFYRDYAQVRSTRVAELVEAVGGIAPRRTLRDAPALATDSFDGDLEVLLAALRRVGASAAVAVELTRAELGVPVWKVIVPGFHQLATGASELRGWRHAP